MEPDQDAAQLGHDAAFTRLLLDSTTEAFYAVNAEGITTLCNASFLKMLGFKSEAEVVGRKLHDVIHHSHPDGSHYAVEDCPIYRAAANGIDPGVISDEFFFCTDGSRVPVEYRAAPIIDQGVLKGAICTFVDISERRRTEERHKLLLRELDHRVKNLFAMMSSIVTLSARTAGSVQELKKAIIGRLVALASAHSLIGASTEGGGQGATATTLRMLLQTVLAPHMRQHGDGSLGVSLNGPEVAVAGEAITSLSLVFHELATNAAKYGALSASEGVVAVRWEVEGGQLALTWTETGGPKVGRAPGVTGFGSVLAERNVVSQLKGDLQFEWLATGVSVSIRVPSDLLGA